MSALAATYYDLLGVNPQATLAEIKAAYQERIEAFHRHQHPSKEAQLDSLREAIDALGDPQARAAYDAQLQSLTAGTHAAGDAPPAVPQIPAAAGVDAGRRRMANFSFTGDGGEYFRIWIVNLLLSIVTLGIYSAWAKVRREQYFHRNLMLDGSGFDYHGRPFAILKGRIIALLLLIGLSLAERAGLAVYGLALLVLGLIAPWLTVKALRFRAYNTSYRGLRFSFHGTYGQAAKVIIGYGLLALLTFWLAFPLYYRQLRKFVLDNTHFGATPLACMVGIGQIYRIFLMPVLLVGLLVVGVLGVTMFMVLQEHEDPFLLILAYGGTVVIPILLLLQLLMVPYLQCRTINAVWGSTRLGPHAFVSRLPVGGYILLTWANWLGIFATLGLFIPWARVRVARYRAMYMGLLVTGSLDDFVAAEATTASAVGDETAGIFDLDIGL
uniref:DUF898 family protein n=1 Tax=Castellaniella defragrans TaxID=75697 RepID=UPI003340E76F